MRDKVPPTKLPPEAQLQWLTQHIPHRIHAVLPWIPMQGPWALDWRCNVELSPPVWLCWQHSMHEGRMAAMRWLIYFIGVQGRSKKPCPFFLDRDTDMRIDRLDGGETYDLSDPKRPDAVMLEEIWRGCSQATSHPTEGTNHPNVEPPRLAAALTLVMGHLQKTVYAHKGRSLLDDTLGRSPL